MLAAPFPDIVYLFPVIAVDRGWCTHVALLKFVDVVLAHDHESLPRVTQVTDYVEEDAGVGATAADVAGADSHTILYH